MINLKGMRDTVFLGLATIFLCDCTPNKFTKSEDLSSHVNEAPQFDGTQLSLSEAAKVSCPKGIAIIYHDQNYNIGNANHGTCKATTVAGSYSYESAGVGIAGVNLSNSNNSARLYIKCGSDGHWYGFTNNSDAIPCSDVGLPTDPNGYGCVKLINGQEYNLGYAGCDGKQF